MLGKITGFLEIDRQDRKYLPAADRIRNYSEFVIPLTEDTVIMVTGGNCDPARFAETLIGQ